MSPHCGKLADALVWYKLGRQILTIGDWQRQVFLFMLCWVEKSVQASGMDKAYYMYVLCIFEQRLTMGFSRAENT
jgi:hypothetical protein